MTLGTILKSVLGPSTSQYYDHPTGNKFFSERNGEEYYHIGHYHTHSHKPKGKSKSDKKHGILSALSLLAFLFFLNILQNCIREQSQETTSVMMFSQGKTPMTTEEYKAVEKRFKRDVDLSAEEAESGTQSKSDNTEIGADVVRKSRTLLQVLTNRQQKFIRHLKNTSNWTNELTQVSDKDLEDQKLKTLNFPLYWKNNGLSSPTDDPKPSALQRNKTDGKGQHGTEIRVVPPGIVRRIKKRERLTTTTEATSWNQTKENTTSMPNIDGHYKNSLEDIQAEKFVPQAYQQAWLHNKTQNGLKSIESITAGFSTNLPETPTVTTPRIRRSEYGGTNHEENYIDYDKSNHLEEASVTTPTPITGVGLNLDTYQTYPMHRYNNHRPTPARENQTEVMDTYVQALTPDLMSSYGDGTRATTEATPYYSQPISSYPKQPHYGKVKYRNKHPNHRGVLLKRNEFPARNRPYRKTGNHNFHDHHLEAYYPIVVAARDPEDDAGLDLINMAWNMITTLAKPLTKLVPSFAKDSQEESQCYDLMVCEAQRASKFMGPTAETLAATVGTVLTWAVTEETRQLIVDAIKSGKENTCQQQIKDCEDRSGGKSTMTIIAQLLELKPR